MEAAFPPSRRLRAALAAEWVGLDRRKLHPWIGLRCTLAVALALAAGLLAGQPAAGAVACSGAATVGFGVWQRFARSELGPMLAGALGMGLSTFIGTCAGLSHLAIGLLVLVWGFFCGLLPALGPGWMWIGQQATIALLVSSSFPGSGAHALIRTVLVLAGGLLQILCIELLLRFDDVAAEWRGWRETRAELTASLALLRSQLTPHSRTFQFAIRVAVTLSAAVLTARFLALRNGYWVGMTALLLLRMEFHDTLVRSVGRIGGTIAGAAVATLLLHLLHPGPAPLAGVVALLAWLAFTTQQFSYALFSVFLTGYIVCLLVFGGLAEQAVAHNRVLGTAIGALFALAAHLHFHLRRARRA